MTDDFGPVCGVLGCHHESVGVVKHPDHGERVVCESHGQDMQSKLVAMEDSA